MIVVAEKVALAAGLVSVAAWIAVYTVTARWWRDPIGRTLVALAVLLAGLCVHPALRVFFGLGGSAATWADVALTGLVTPVMAWRIVVWVRLSRAGRHPAGGGQPARDDLAS